MTYGDDWALQEMEKIKQALGNLLAVIHHDGGQYVSEYGLLKSIEDGRELIIKERELFDAYKYQMSGHDRGYA